MFKGILSGTLILSAFTLAAHADPAADVKAAAKKLGDSANYSWKSTIEGGNARGGGATAGKTEKDGYTDITITMGDNTIEAVMKGDQAALKLADGWKTVPEASAGEAGQPNPGRFIARMVQNYKTPAAVAEDVASKVKELAKADDAYAGELTEDGAKALMAFGGRRGGANANATPPAITNPKGTAKFWVDKDGVLSKFEYNVQGSISFNGQDRDINRTTTIEIKDVGSTKIDVPAEGKAKMAATK
jgi:hypothetical protein